MKKEYSKPQISIESFELNESIAGPCAENGMIIDTFHDVSCVLEFEGFFADDYCLIEPDNDDDMYCHDTYVGTEGYFWS